MKPMAQRGIALISAIFILLVLAVMGAVAVTISTTEQIGSAQDVESARVYQAARAGMEWGLYEVRMIALLPAQAAGTACPADTEVTMPATAITLAGITVSVRCFSGGAGTPYRITSTACNQPAAGNAVGSKCPNTTNPNSLYIERLLEVIF